MNASERSRYQGWVTIPGTGTRLCTRQGLIVPQPMRVGSVLSCVLGPFCLLLLLGTLCYAHTTPATPPTMCAHLSVHGYKCAHTRTHHAFITTVSAHHHTQPQDQPPPCTESPSERPCRQAKPTNKHDRDEHHNSDSSARHQVGGFCLAEILGFGTRIGNPFFTCNWDFSLEWRGFTVFGCAFWVLECFGAVFGWGVVVSGCVS